MKFGILDTRPYSEHFWLTYVKMYICSWSRDIFKTHYFSMCKKYLHWSNPMCNAKIYLLRRDKFNLL